MKIIYIVSILTSLMMHIAEGAESAVVEESSVREKGFDQAEYEERYRRVITSLGLPVEQFMMEFPLVPKVNPPNPGIIALRRDFLNGESHVCIKSPILKGSAFIVALKRGKVVGCKFGLIGPSNEEPEKDYENCTAAVGYPGAFFPTTAHCVRALRVSYTAHQKEISAAASKRNALLQGIE